MRLDIFLRTCSRRGVHSNQRIIPDDRETMIKKCFLSLLDAIEVFQHDVKLWIIDDNSNQEFIQWMKDRITCKYEIFEHSEPLGYHESAVKQFEIAMRESSYLVYLLEDDYYHSEQSLNIMASTVKFMERHISYYSAVFPYDCIDRYHRDYPELSKIYYNDGMYFRTVSKSSNTVMMSKAAYRLMYDSFIHLAKNFNPDGSCDEDTTINKHYVNFEKGTGEVMLVSPIPSLAVHIEYKSPTFVSDLGISNFHNHWPDF